MSGLSGGGVKRARQAGKPREQTPWSLLPVESQPCRGREEPGPAREVDALADGDGGGRVTCIPWKSLSQGAGEEEEET